MIQCIRTVCENGVLRPLQPLDLQEQTEVQLTVEDAASLRNVEGTQYDDPFAAIRIDTGIPDLAERFDDCRFGRITP